MSDIDLSAIREKLRKVDVLSGISGAAARADLDAICEDLAFNDVADLLAEVDRLRAENAAMQAALAAQWGYAKAVPGLIQQATKACADQNAAMQQVVEAAREHTKGLLASSRPTAIMLRDAVARYDAAQGEKRGRN